MEGKGAEQTLTWSLPATRMIPKAPSTSDSMHWNTTCGAPPGVSDFRRDITDTGDSRSASYIKTDGSRLPRRKVNRFVCRSQGVVSSTARTE